MLSKLQLLLFVLQLCEFWPAQQFSSMLLYPILNLHFSQIHSDIILPS